MDLFSQSWDYIVQNPKTFWGAVSTHLQLSLAALAISILICVPLGIWTARHEFVGRTAIQGIGILRVIPSLAVLLLLLPYLKTGFAPALVALTLLALPPVLINTDAAIRGVDPAVIEAARGMGMGRFRVLGQIELPLAMPVILTGIRTAAVEVIASATLATFIGAGGLGDFITQGIEGVNRVRYLLFVGAVPVTLLAFAADLLLSGLQRWMNPAH